MASFVLSFFPLDVLDKILDLIESVSERFLTYSCTMDTKLKKLFNLMYRFSKFSLIEKFHGRSFYIQMAFSNLVCKNQDLKL